MKIAIGADHAGFNLKQRIGEALRQDGHTVTDRGTWNGDSTDYPDYAAAVAQDVASGAADSGVLICTTGVGMSIAANKIPGIRAALAVNTEEVRLTRQHNNANVLTIGAKFTDSEAAVEFVKLFLETPFEGTERHARRVQKIARLEKQP